MIWLRQGQVAKLRSELGDLKTKIDRLNKAFTEGALEIAEFKELKNPLIPQKTDLEQKLTVLETGTVSRLEPLKQWVLRANQAEKWVSDDNWVEMKSFLQNVGSNRLLRAETLTVSFKKPWNLLAETTVAMRSVSDASARNSGWWRRRELNPRPWQSYQPRLHA